MKNTFMQGTAGRVNLVAVGVRRDGINLLTRFLESIPTKTSLSYLVVAEASDSEVSAWRDRERLPAGISLIPLKEPVRICPGCVYLVASGESIRVHSNLLQPDQSPVATSAESGIELCFSRIAEVFGSRSVGVLLGAFDESTASGVQAIRQAGGVFAAAVAHSPANRMLIGGSADPSASQLRCTVSELPRRLEEVLGSRLLPSLRAVTTPNRTKTSAREVDWSVVLGKSVRSRRSELGWSQEKLAERAGLNRTYITDVERGARNVSLSTIDRLAQALEVPIQFLLRDLEGPSRTGGGEIGGSGPEAQVEILLVEDNPLDVELTLRALRRAHLSNPIHVERNGTRALEYLFREGTHASTPRPARLPLVLLDLNLPGLDGLEVLRAIRGNPVTARIPVIVLTSSQAHRDRMEAMDLGVDAYIVKPVDFQQLSQIAPRLNLAWTLTRPPVLPASRLDS